VFKKIRDAWARQSYKALIRQYEDVGIKQEQIKWQQEALRRKLRKPGALADFETKLSQISKSKQEKILELLKEMGIEEKNGRLVEKEDRRRWKPRIF
jgi:hypothetical protein